MISGRRLSVVLWLLAVACGGRAQRDDGGAGTGTAGSGTVGSGGSGGSASAGSGGSVDLPYAECPPAGSPLAEYQSIEQSFCAVKGATCGPGGCDLNCVCQDSQGAPGPIWSCVVPPCPPPDTIACPTDATPDKLFAMRGQACSTAGERCGGGGCSMTCYCTQADGGVATWDCFALPC